MCVNVCDVHVYSMDLCISIALSLLLSLAICVCVCVCVSLYIYMYVYNCCDCYSSRCILCINLSSISLFLSRYLYLSLSLCMCMYTDGLSSLPFTLLGEEPVTDTDHIHIYISQTQVYLLRFDSVVVQEKSMPRGVGYRSESKT